MINFSEALGTSEIARRMGVSRTTVGDWMTNGVTVRGAILRLKSIRVGKAWKSTEGWLEEFVAACNGSPIPDESATARDGRGRKEMERVQRAT